MQGCKPPRADGYLPWRWLNLDWDDAHSCDGFVNPWEASESLLPVRVRDQRQVHDTMVRMKKNDLFLPDDLIEVVAAEGRLPDENPFNESI